MGWSPPSHFVSSVALHLFVLLIKFVGEFAYLSYIGVGVCAGPHVLFISPI